MRIITAKNGIKYLRSDLIRCTHGFSTRVGGTSKLPHTASLNLAFGRGDDDKTVLDNLTLFANALGFDAQSIVSCPQIHSSIVKKVGLADQGKGYYAATDFECDGYVTTSQDVTLGVKTADCVPVLLAAEDKNGQVFAVSALHAGWRGTAKNIVSSGVDSLIEFGAMPERIFAAIGPCINQCCFEVGSDCKDEILRSLGSCFDEFIVSNGDKYYPDLTKINRRLLTLCSIPEANIDTCDLCTYCNPELFYSHRFSSGVRGSMLSVIGIS